ncbi:MAG TPA: hypothetical protein VE567_09420 [Sphingomonas sp.]|nr:hypothetical protein [Sphingomonas sp.]
MGPFLYVMAIMGCGDGGYQCAEARLLQTRYTSLAACQQAAQSELIRNSDLEFPELLASCRSLTNQIVMADTPKAITH